MSVNGLLLGIGRFPPIECWDARGLAGLSLAFEYLVIGVVYIYCTHLGIVNLLEFGDGLIQSHNLRELFTPTWLFWLMHPWKLTWHLKIDHWKKSFLLKTISFRLHVSFRRCMWKQRYRKATLQQTQAVKSLVRHALSCIANASNVWNQLLNLYSDIYLQKL